VTIWPKRAKVGLAIGAILWISGLALLPGELAAAKQKTRIGARTVATSIVFLLAAVTVLYGLPRLEKPPELPQK
jgi:hypothetical protein